jgi:hypothetical protein
LGVRFRYNAYRTDGGAANHSLNYSLFQDLIYRPNRRLNLKISVDEYFFGKSPRLYLFVRPDFSYSFPKHGLSVGFSAYNMLNHDRLSDYQLTDYYLQEEDYGLVSAQYLFNVRVRF